MDYRVKPAIAGGGEVIIYAPHITEVRYTCGKIIDEVGYHCRDYFVAQWQRFTSYPGGVPAHSTHVEGLRTFDLATAVETPRIRVTLATEIPKSRCRRINLGYMDLAAIKVEDWTGCESKRVLIVPCAGEMLYRLRKTQD